MSENDINDMAAIGSIDNGSDNLEIGVSESLRTTQVPSPNTNSTEEVNPQIEKKPGDIPRSRIPILSYCPSTIAHSSVPLRNAFSCLNFSTANPHTRIPILAKRVVPPVTNEIRSLSKPNNSSVAPVANEIRPLSKPNNSSVALIANVIRSPTKPNNSSVAPVANEIRSPSKLNNSSVAPVANEIRSTSKPNNSPDKFIRKEPRLKTEDGREQCRICHRFFVPDRLIVHEKICKKAKTRKRKAFDPVKHRIQGTDAEPYLRLALLQPAIHVKKLSWRKQHEDFIITIRAAKEAQAYVAKGGKLSDLPPPPPSDTSHYTPCPHCGRKFNETAAARHIPRCAEMKHNKPKPKNNQAKVAPKIWRTK